MNDTSQDLKRVSIVGTGSCLPERILTNAEIEKMVDTSDEWIRTRTGIRQRHIAADNQATSDIAAEAARRALADAAVLPTEVDMIIVATITPDMPFPATACFVQEKIGAKNAFCFDIEAACSGFLYGIEVARGMLMSGAIKTVLVIGAEKLSCVTDWQDRATCVLFGDGAGAAVLRAGNHGRGIIASILGSDGALTGLLNIPGGGSAFPTSPESIAQRQHYMKMTGNEVFKHAVRCMCDAGNRVLSKSGMTIDDVDCVIPHQANMRIIRAIATRFGHHCIKKFYVNLERVGNMSAASVPVALDDAARDGTVKNGDILLFIVFGGGFTWGATLMEWNNGK